jgi:hypothetical protein
MNRIEFRPIQLLSFTEADQPNITLEQGVWTLVANRNGEQIMITAPDNRKSLYKAQPVSHARQVKKKKTRKTDLISRGENHPKAKLTESDVRELRNLFNDPDYRREFDSDHQVLMDLSKVYGIHHTTVYKIVNNMSWRHLAND